VAQTSRHFTEPGLAPVRVGHLFAVLGLGMGYGEASETVYLVMTFDDADRVAHDGFADRCYGSLRGVMASTTPLGMSCVNADTAVLAVLLDAGAFEPYAFSETEACIPAEILNAGYAELVEHESATGSHTAQGRPSERDAALSTGLTAL
jgi:hypothetical protein